MLLLNNNSLENHGRTSNLVPTGAVSALDGVMVIIVAVALTYFFTKFYRR